MKSTIVGIRHAFGLCGETYWFDNLTKWLSRKLRKGDKVMLEIPEYPFSELFNNHNSVDYFQREFMKSLCSYLEEKQCQIIPVEDRERWYNDPKYFRGRIRDNQVFIPKMRDIKPRFFLVGYDHLNYLKEKMPEFDYIKLVDEEKDKKMFYWLNIVNPNNQQA